MYLDAAYIVRLYLPDPGFELVRNLVARSPSKPASLIHGRAEVCAAMHRWFREGRMDAAKFATVFDQFETDCRREKFDWLPLTDAVMAKIAASFRSLPAVQFLRAGDALHLACAASMASRRFTRTTRGSSPPRRTSEFAA